MRDNIPLSDTIYLFDINKYGQELEVTTDKQQKTYSCLSQENFYNIYESFVKFLENHNLRTRNTKKVIDYDYENISFGDTHLHTLISFVKNDKPFLESYYGIDNYIQCAFTINSSNKHTDNLVAREYLREKGNLFAQQCKKFGLKFIIIVNNSKFDNIDIEYNI